MKVEQDLLSCVLSGLLVSRLPDPPPWTKAVSVEGADLVVAEPVLEPRDLAYGDGLCVILEFG